MRRQRPVRSTFRRHRCGRPSHRCRHRCPWRSSPTRRGEAPCCRLRTKRSRCRRPSSAGLRRTRLRHRCLSVRSPTHRGERLASRGAPASTDRQRDHGRGSRCRTRRRRSRSSPRRTGAGGPEGLRASTRRRPSSGAIPFPGRPKRRRRRRSAPRPRVREWDRARPSRRPPRLEVRRPSGGECFPSLRRGSSCEPRRTS
jgi:hypothetical protein